MIVKDNLDVPGILQRSFVLFKQHQLHQLHQPQRQFQHIVINLQSLQIVQVQILVHGMELPVLISQDVQPSHRLQMINVKRFQPDA